MTVRRTIALKFCASVKCGCFYWCANFKPDEILEWAGEDNGRKGQTAICPRCGIDAVIGDKSGVDVSHDFWPE